MIKIPRMWVNQNGKVYEGLPCSVRSLPFHRPDGLLLAIRDTWYPPRRRPIACYDWKGKPPSETEAGMWTALRGGRDLACVPKAAGLLMIQ